MYNLRKLHFPSLYVNIYDLGKDFLGNKAERRFVISKNLNANRSSAKLINELKHVHNSLIHVQQKWVLATQFYRINCLK